MRLRYLLDLLRTGRRRVSATQIFVGNLLRARRRRVNAAARERSCRPKKGLAPQRSVAANATFRVLDRRRKRTTEDFAQKFWLQQKDDPRVIQCEATTAGECAASRLRQDSRGTYPAARSCLFSHDHEFHQFLNGVQPFAFSAKLWYAGGEPRTWQALRPTVRDYLRCDSGVSRGGTSERCSVEGPRFHGVPFSRAPPQPGHSSERCARFHVYYRRSQDVSGPKGAGAEEFWVSGPSAPSFAL